MIKIRLFAFLLLLPYYAYAGDTAKIKIHTLGLETGYGTNFFIDPYASAKLYSANCLPVKFRWLTEYSKHLEKFDVGILSSSYSSSVNSIHLTDFKGFQANIGFVYFINILKKRNSSFYLGPGINFLYSFNKYKFRFFEKVFYNTVDILISADINPAMKINFNKDWVLINTSCSLFAYTGYLKYSLGSPFDGSLQVFPRYKSFSFEPVYFYQFSKKVILNLGYKFFYYSFPKFETADKTNRLNNLFTIGVDVKL